jgi:hypothetical protein
MFDPCNRAKVWAPAQVSGPDTPSDVVVEVEPCDDGIPRDLGRLTRQQERCARMHRRGHRSRRTKVRNPPYADAPVLQFRTFKLSGGYYRIEDAATTNAPSRLRAALDE